MAKSSVGGSGQTSSVAHWLVRRFGRSDWHVKTQQRGNTLHVLLEGASVPSVQDGMAGLIDALSAETIQDYLPKDAATVYMVALYGRKRGESNHRWFEAVHLNQLDRYCSWLELERLGQGQTVPVQDGQSQNEAQQEGSGSLAVQVQSRPGGPIGGPIGGAIVVSNRSLAERGDLDSIARYLSETLSGYDVAVTVSSRPRKADPEAAPRLWVTCETAYSLDAALVADPIAQKLRELHLDFSDAAIVSRVRGEASPEWVLRVDLTPSDEMLQDWARWGDSGAIEILLREALADQASVTVQLRQKAVHVFCSALAPAQPSRLGQGYRGRTGSSAKNPSEPTLDRQTLTATIDQVLTQLAPQGVHAATIHAMPADDPDGAPLWLEWLTLPAATNEQLMEPALELAESGDLPALQFVLTRFLNPDLAVQLATGGLRVQLVRKPDMLHVMCDGPTCPDQATVAKPLARYVQQLRLPRVAGVRIYGRRSGLARPLWRYGRNFVPRSQDSQETAPQFMAVATPGDLLLSGAVAATVLAEPNLESPDLSAYETADPLADGRSADQSLDSLAAALDSGAIVEVSETLAPEAPAPRTPRWVWPETDWLTPIADPLRQTLMGTGLFVTMPDSRPIKLGKGKFGGSAANQTLSAQGLRSDSPDRRGSPIQQPTWMVATVWGALGLLSPLLLDLSVGQGLKWAYPPGPSASALPPELTLNGLGNRATEGFNNSGFTLSPPALGSPTGPTATGSAATGSAATSSAATGSAATGTPTASLPKFNNAILDLKIDRYHQLLLQEGPPDVLILGSSRALRGVDPVALGDRLGKLGFAGLRIYNFAINGSTAQVVDLQLRQLLQPDQLPRLILWADGARAFNSGPSDRTYESIVQSEGFAQLGSGIFATNRDNKALVPGFLGLQQVLSQGPTLDRVDRWLNLQLGTVSSLYHQRANLTDSLQQLWQGRRPGRSRPAAIPLIPNAPEGEGTLDDQGFIPLSLRFNPATYYQQYTKVSGAYDDDYQGFRMVGKQQDSLDRIITFAQQKSIPLVFVNLPLTTEYLDPVRRGYETVFQENMVRMMSDRRLLFRDLSELWPDRLDYFSDPSHLNLYGARQVSIRLAEDPLIPWPSAR
jgi:hypothetical protein